MSADGESSAALHDTATTQTSAWEAAYLDFETPEQEIRKFETRLLDLGAGQWPRNSRILELFCGRGNGLHALRSLGFEKICGVDLSPALAKRYRGSGTVMVGDCRHLPFADASCDVLIVQGGLHHLFELPVDLDLTLSEAARVLRRDGRLVVVEPWLTPFLRLVHRVCRVALARAMSRKIKALATMIENEKTTYEQWLRNPGVTRASLNRYFAIVCDAVGMGKLRLVGRKR